MKKRVKIWLGLLVLLISWVVFDLTVTFRRNIAQINPARTASLEQKMWRSYYEKKSLKLFLESAELMRSEFHFSFWQSFRVAYYAAKAAFVFKDGRNRMDYEKALPYLEKYYGMINRISEESFDVDSAARSELEWWIIRRERDKHQPAEWENWLATTASIVYHLPRIKFQDYAHLRVQAMLLRDSKGKAITEHDWENIHEILLSAWQCFARDLHDGQL